jgi:hypothetical protein
MIFNSPCQRYPNFIIGGTAAGGTSFLSAILIQHPQIYLPKEMRPEPHYYYKSWEYEKGIEYYSNRWFHDVPDSAIAIGERSSSYLFGGDSVARKIFSDFPEMKFIFTLRNPIERTWANYRYTVLQGLEDLPFEEALSKEQDRIVQQSGIWAEIQPYNYTGRGFYAKQIKQYLNYYELKNILCIKSELLSSQTSTELQKICHFLGLTQTVFKYESVPDHTAVNVLNPKLQMELREYFSDRFDKVIEAVRKNVAVDTQILKTSEDKRMFELLSKNLTASKTPMPSAARSYLAELFADDIQSLGDLVDFELTDWK